MPATLRSILLFALAAVAEIGGAWLIWQGVREHRGVAWVGAGIVALAAYGFVATLQPDANFGRILAAYGGIFVAGSLAKGRTADWQSLLAHVERREPIDGGVRSVLAPSVPIGDLMRLVTAEQDCCQFFRFAITVDTRGVALEVRAPDDALEIVESMFGTRS
jgi:small multidrug resistance family-3 protein